MTIPVPTFSASGWCYDTAEKLDFLIAHFLESDPKQSNIYRGNVSSITTIQVNAFNDPSGYKQQLENILNDFLSRYFNRIELSTEIEVDELTQMFTVKLYSIVEENNQRFSINHLIHSNGKNVNKIRRIIDGE